MPEAYWIARIDVTDPEAYRLYASGAAAAFQRYGATYLVRGGAFTAAEGQARERNVVIEFPSCQAALDCYNSKEYRAARAHRLPPLVRPAGNPESARRKRGRISRGAY